MKNLIKYASVSLVAAILLSSCGSNFSITKRHYTNGYYIDYTKNNKGVISNPIENIAQVNTPAPSVVAPAPAKGANVAQAQAQNNDQNNQVVTSNNNKKQIKANLRVITKPVQVNKAGVFSSIPKKDKHTLFESPNISNSISDHDEGSAALSLLWLVIVIILILWLIGILAGGFGLGGLINLLLLIALILLILWLLRIL
ncbi:MAG TPA: DUF5670 family protein [Bacteroidia bacterium]|jgi:hypothetical protein|nr:DUF5670 family protein [Bacteroidia bacterium]